MADTSKGTAPRIEKTRTAFRSLISANPNYFGNLPDSGFKKVASLASKTTYEELTSVGYNPWQKRLFATFDIKKAFGYSGNLCDDGSTEYVRFFVDFGGGWQDAGVVATDVHDIPTGKDCANRRPTSADLFVGTAIRAGAQVVHHAAIAAGAGHPLMERRATGR